MSINVTLVQRGPRKKSIPLELITDGGRLAYGVPNPYGLDLGRCDGGRIMVFDPKKAGRAITVDWEEDLTDSLFMRMNNPTPVAEIHEFYQLVGRVATFWGCEALECNDERVELAAFMKSEEGAYAQNEAILGELFKHIMTGDKEYSSCYVFGARVPLEVGLSEALAFHDDKRGFLDWLASCQQMDVEYLFPMLMSDEDGLVGIYTLPEGRPAIIPRKPGGGAGMFGEESALWFKCEDWVLTVVGNDGLRYPHVIDYDDFLRRVRPHCKRFDTGHLLLEGLSVGDVLDLSDQMEGDGHAA